MRLSPLCERYEAVQAGIIGQTAINMQTEMNAGLAKHGDFCSVHEALGVISEHWDELREVARKGDLRVMAEEALHVAACAARLVAQIDATLR